MKANSRFQQGMTLVELLLSMAILALVIAAIAPRLVQSGHYESNIRAVAETRTALSRDLERLARGVSLANGISHGDGATALTYPAAWGGVSFETNRLARVASANLSRQGESLQVRMALFEGLDADARGEAIRNLGGGPVATGLSHPALAGFTAANAAGQPDLLILSLSANVPQRSSSGELFHRTVTVTRYARMWNK